MFSVHSEYLLELVPPWPWLITVTVILLSSALHLLRPPGNVGRAGRASNVPQNHVEHELGQEWTLAAWLTSAPGLADALAHAMLKRRHAGQSELEFARSLGKGAEADDLLKLLQQTGALNALAETLATNLKQLASTHQHAEAKLQLKFMQEGATQLRYGAISTFYSGLEGIVGAPNPKVREAMEREHNDCGDSKEEFTSPNYNVTTTSSIEWAFVVHPKDIPPSGWPREEKIHSAKFARGMSATIDSSKNGGRAGAGRPSPQGAVLKLAGTQGRRTLTVEDLKFLLVERSLQLQEIGEKQGVLLEEGIAARLYTGPLYVKYNWVLRGLGSDQPSGQEAMLRLCCSRADFEAHKSGALPYAEARRRLNTYTTTLHAINSCIVKLSKLTVATKVYRGVSGSALPREFWEPNRYGIKGGIEMAFMSTTTNREVALSYASMKSAGFVFEISQGMVDRGADVSFLSQYPQENEILFAPLIGLEVRSTRVDGAALAVSVSLSINLASLTIEQVVGRRKKMLLDMLPGVKAELREQLSREGRANSQGIDYLVSVLEVRLEERGTLAHEAEWYTCDERMQAALGELLQAKRELGSGGRAWADALLALKSVQRDAMGFSGPAFTSEVIEALGKLEDTGWGVRDSAVKVLRTLDSASLAVHAADIVAKLGRSRKEVRKAASALLSRLDPASLAPHAAALVAMLKQSDMGVRFAAVETLGRLDAAALHDYVPTLDEFEANESIAQVRICAATALIKVHPETLQERIDEVVAKLQDPNPGIRKVALWTLGNLDVASVRRHATTVLGMLEDPDDDVRIAATRLKGEMDL